MNHAYIKSTEIDWKLLLEPPIKWKFEFNCTKSLVKKMSSFIWGGALPLLQYNWTLLNNNLNSSYARSALIEMLHQPTPPSNKPLTFPKSGLQIHPWGMFKRDGMGKAIDLPEPNDKQTIRSASAPPISSTCRSSEGPSCAIATCTSAWWMEAPREGRKTYKVGSDWL